MAFEEALAILKDRRWGAIGRRDWRAVLLLIYNDASNPALYDGFYLHWPSGALSRWEPTQADLLARDWELRG